MAPSDVAVRRRCPRRDSPYRRTRVPCPSSGLYRGRVPSPTGARRRRPGGEPDEGVKRAVPPRSVICTLRPDASALCGSQEHSDPALVGDGVADAGENRRRDGSGVVRAEDDQVSIWKPSAASCTAPPYRTPGHPTTSRPRWMPACRRVATASPEPGGRLNHSQADDGTNTPPRRDRCAARGPSPRWARPARRWYGGRFARLECRQRRPGECRGTWRTSPECVGKSGSRPLGGAWGGGGGRRHFLVPALDGLLALDEGDGGGDGEERDGQPQAWAMPPDEWEAGRSRSRPPGRRSKARPVSRAMPEVQACAGRPAGQDDPAVGRPSTAAEDDGRGDRGAHPVPRPAADTDQHNGRDQRGGRTTAQSADHRPGTSNVAAAETTPSAMKNVAVPQT